MLHTQYGRAGVYRDGHLSDLLKRYYLRISKLTEQLFAVHLSGLDIPDILLISEHLSHINKPFNVYNSLTSIIMRYLMASRQSISGLISAPSLQASAVGSILQGVKARDIIRTVYNQYTARDAPPLQCRVQLDGDGSQNLSFSRRVARKASEVLTPTTTRIRFFLTISIHQLNLERRLFLLKTERLSIKATLRPYVQFLVFLVLNSQRPPQTLTLLRRYRGR